MKNTIQQGKMTFFTWENSKNWPVCEVSQNVFQLLGYSSEEFLSGDTRYAGLIHPDDLELVVQEVSDALQNRYDEFTHQIYRVKHKNGTYKKIYDHTKIIYDLDGKPTHFKGCIYDKTEELLHKERLELVLKGTGLGVWDWNPQTNEISFDEQWAKMLGYDLSKLEMNFDTWKNLIHPDDLTDCFEELQNHSLGKTEFYQHIHRMKHKEGHWVYIWDRGKFVEWDEDCNPIHFTGTHTDISKQKEAENDLIQEMKTKENFFALMSHEIRTPMNGIIGFTDLLLEDKNLSKDQEESLSIIKKSSGSLLKLINNILDYAKLKSGVPILDNRAFNLKYSLNELIKSLYTIAKENNNQIHLDMDSNISEFLIGDEVRLLQIVRNLLSNALKFTKNDEVNVKVFSIDDLIQFEIKDCGIGIDNKKLDQLFLPFVQENSSIARVFGGTGLGLTLCRTLVELMDGKIWVKSTLGKGTSFFFTVKLEEEFTKS